MGWLTWRQHRAEAAAILTVLVALAVGVLLLTLAGSGMLATLSRGCAAGVCTTNFALFFQSGLFEGWTLVMVAVIAVPVVFGVFVGAPMIARELEHGTQFVAWSQGVTRRRWFVSRVGLVVLSSVVGAAILAAIAQGWFAVQRDLVNSNAVVGGFTFWDGFDIAPPVVIAYTLFALALGVAAGAALRRTVPAMALTLAAYIAVRVPLAQLARWRYLPPVTARLSDGGQLVSVASLPGPSDWQLTSYPPTYVDAAGHALNASSVNRLLEQCSGGSPSAAPTCPSALNGVYTLLQYQPALRFWLFQGIEAAIFLVLAVALLALAYRLVMRLR
jgi:hypothetical protein